MPFFALQDIYFSYIKIKKIEMIFKMRKRAK
jgi:hypothetical protein